jgi:hypothetical protein
LWVSIPLFVNGNVFYLVFLVVGEGCCIGPELESESESESESDDIHVNRPCTFVSFASPATIIC